MILASLFQFSFLCVVALANLCFGFAIASRLGWGPRLGALFQFDLATPEEPVETAEVEPAAGDVEESPAQKQSIDDTESESVEPIVAVEPTDDDTDQSDDQSSDSGGGSASELSTTAGSGV